MECSLGFVNLSNSQIYVLTAKTQHAIVAHVRQKKYVATVRLVTDTLKDQKRLRFEQITQKQRTLNTTSYLGPF